LGSQKDFMQPASFMAFEGPGSSGKALFASGFSFKFLAGLIV